MNFFFSDEDAKDESKREGNDPEETQAQSRDGPQPSEESGSSSFISACGVLRNPEQPDLADRSSQFSFKSDDGTGEHERTVSSLMHID